MNWRPLRFSLLGSLIEMFLIVGLGLLTFALYVLLLIPMTFSEKLCHYFERVVNYLTAQTCYLIEGRPLVPEKF